MSIAEFAIAAGAIAWIVEWLTGSAIAAVAGAAVFALNPNVLYLQSTPMTEPLLLATTTVAVAMLMAWCGADRMDGSPEGLRTNDRAAPCPRRSSCRPSGLPCRLGLRARLPDPLRSLAGDRERAGRRRVGALAARPAARRRRSRDVGAVAVYPAVAIVGFAIFSRVVVGAWFVGSDFFVPENKALGDPMMAAAEIGWGAQLLSGPALTWIGGAGVAARGRRSASSAASARTR